MAKFPNGDIGTALKLLAKYGVACAHVSFDGSGDSGQIQDIDHYEGVVERDKLHGAPVTKEDMEEAGEHVHASTTGNLYDLITTCAYIVLNKSEYDWYNNDGGWGTIELVPGEGRAVIDMNVRYTDSTNHEEDFSVEVEQDG